MGNCSSPLRYAMRNNSAKQVKAVLDEAGEGSPDIINEDFTADCILDSCQTNLNTPLHTSLSTGQIEIFELLLKYGGDPNAPSRSFGQTVLHQAARQNNMTAAKLAVQFGADLRATDNDGKYPVHCAALSLISRVKNRVDVLQYLVEEVGKADDIHLTDAYGNTPLHAAAKNENLAAVRYLIEKGADLTARNENGKTPADVTKISFRKNLVKQ